MSRTVHEQSVEPTSDPAILAAIQAKAMAQIHEVVSEACIQSLHAVQGARAESAEAAVAQAVRSHELAQATFREILAAEAAAISETVGVGAAVASETVASSGASPSRTHGIGITATKPQTSAETPGVERAPRRQNPFGNGRVALSLVCIATLAVCFALISILQAPRANGIIALIATVIVGFCVIRATQLAHRAP